MFLHFPSRQQDDEVFLHFASPRQLKRRMKRIKAGLATNESRALGELRRGGGRLGYGGEKGGRKSRKGQGERETWWEMRDGNDGR